MLPPTMGNTSDQLTIRSSLAILNSKPMTSPDIYFTQGRFLFQLKLMSRWPTLHHRTWGVPTIPLFKFNIRKMKCFILPTEWHNRIFGTSWNIRYIRLMIFYQTANPDQHHPLPPRILVPHFDQPVSNSDCPLHIHPHLNLSEAQPRQSYEPHSSNKYFDPSY